MFKTVLTPLTGTETDVSALAASLAIVTLANGHIECVCVVPEITAVATQIDQAGMGGWMFLSTKLADLERETKLRSESARVHFSEFCEKEGIQITSDTSRQDAVTASWREDVGEEFMRVTELSRCHDLVVLAGGGDPAFSKDFIGGVIMGSGRPVLIAPQKERREPSGAIAIAWKATPETARAVTAAMPLLESAERIDVLSAVEPPKSSDAYAASLEGLTRYLQWHGFDVRQHIVPLTHESAAGAVLQRVQDLGVDLLVMGGYGHSRVRELVFGGFTERVLAGVDLPVFLFH
jgi:nucleotide-binding universal stress UspA family protein